MQRFIVTGISAILLALFAVQVHAQTASPSPSPSTSPSPSPAATPQGAPNTGFGGF